LLPQIVWSRPPSRVSELTRDRNLLRLLTAVPGVLIGWDQPSLAREWGVQIVLPAGPERHDQQNKTNRSLHQDSPR
jgi:hypothetical protein